MFSIGVIHHLEFPERAIRPAWSRPPNQDGKVLIWVYGAENNDGSFALSILCERRCFSRLPIGFVHHLSLYPTLVLWLG